MGANAENRLLAQSAARKMAHQRGATGRSQAHCTFCTDRIEHTLSAWAMGRSVGENALRRLARSAAAGPTRYAAAATLLRVANRIKL